MRWHATLAALGAAAALVLQACGGGGADDGEAGQAAIGPIPAAEFASVPVPTYRLVITAFRTVTTANPALLANEPALSRALFDEVKRLVENLPAAGGGRTVALGRAGRRALFDLEARLTHESWKLVIRSPLDSARAATTIEVSAQAAIAQMSCDADIGYTDGKADALRHAYWSALMTRRTSAAFAERFATAHETGSSNRPAATAMDQHNNAIGRALAVRYPAAGDAELLELLSQQAFLHVAGAATVPPAWRGLVHIAEGAVRPFDGDFTGSLIEAGVGGATYALRLDLAQCGAIVRGRWVATRDSLAFERRFSGTLSAATTMTLVMADPLPSEVEAGPRACLGLKVELAGGEKELAGRWSSQGPSGECVAGGTLSVARP